MSAAQQSAALRSAEEVRSALAAVIEREGEFAEMKSEDFTFESLYITAAKRHPEITFAEYDTAEDNVQLLFLELANLPATSLLELLDANQADIRNGELFLRGSLPLVTRSQAAAGAGWGACAATG